MSFHTPPSQTLAGLLSQLFGRRFLYVGRLPLLPAVLRGAPLSTGFATTLRRMDAALMQRTVPEVVISPLLCDRHDIIDIARKLELLGYHGRLRAISPRLPKVRMVYREVQEVWPEGDFEICEIAQTLH